MCGEEMKRRVDIQIKKILVDKWDEGVRINRDPGDAFIIEWIKNHAEEFNVKWEKSKCKTCVAACDCGFKLATECGYYSKIQGGQ